MLDFFRRNGSRIASWLICLLPETRCNGTKTWLLRHVGGIQIGNECEIWSGSKFIGQHIQIGDHCHIGSGVIIAGLSREGYVQIGSNCSIGPQVYMTTGSHQIGSSDRRSGKGVHRPIIIGAGCGLSMRCMPMAGVKIGAGSFIGPGVVVSQDVPPNTLVAQASVRTHKLPVDGIEW
jgi:maltose O-acetyltransferase